MNETSVSFKWSEVEPLCVIRLLLRKLWLLVLAFLIGYMCVSLVLGNLMIAAASIGVGSCWINRAKEYFDMPAGKEVLKKWGLDEKYRGVGICVLGYADGPVPAAKPRKADYIRRV